MSRRPRLLILVTLAEIGGAQTYVSLLVPGLVQDFDVIVAAHGQGPLQEAVQVAGARFVPLRHVRRSIHPWSDLRGLAELVRLCRRERPDIVHANSSKAGVLGRLAARLAGVPIRVFTVHGWAFAAYRGFAGRLYLWADRLMRPLTTLVICVAEVERERGLRARTCAPGRTEVVRNGVDTASFQASALDGDPPRLVSVGRFTYPKDFGTLIEALARVESPFRAVLVGDGPERAAAKEQVRELGLAERVDLPGERRGLHELLAASDAFVLSSRSEGLPMSVLEAMAAGLPVVASNVGGVPELVAEGENGLLVPAGDADALARALDRLLADAGLRQELGMASRKRAEESFGVAQFRQRHVELYARELERAGLSPPAEASANI